MDPDKQTFQVVFATLFDFIPFNVNVLKPDLFALYKAVQIETQRSDVCCEFFLCLLE